MLFGCATVKPISIENIGQQPGVELSTNIGDIFFEKEEMSGKENSINGIWLFNAQRMELAVRSATKDKLVLDYSEFYKSGSGSYGEIRTSDPWLKKPAFDKSLEFDLADSKNIYFKKFEFEIIDVKGGRIKYRRIK